MSEILGDIAGLVRAPRALLAAGDPRDDRAASGMADRASFPNFVHRPGGGRRLLPGIADASGALVASPVIVRTFPSTEHIRGSGEPNSFRLPSFFRPFSHGHGGGENKGI